MVNYVARALALTIMCIYKIKYELPLYIG